MRRTTGDSGVGSPCSISSVDSDSAISVAVDDVDVAYAEARRRGYEIAHPLTQEPWGTRRFFVRDPNGVVVNVVGHPD